MLDPPGSRGRRSPARARRPSPTTWPALSWACWVCPRGRRARTPAAGRKRPGRPSGSPRVAAGAGRGVRTARPGRTRRCATAIWVSAASGSPSSNGYCTRSAMSEHSSAGLSASSRRPEPGEHQRHPEHRPAREQRCCRGRRHRGLCRPPATPANRAGRSVPTAARSVRWWRARYAGVVVVLLGDGHRPARAGLRRLLHAPLDPVRLRQLHQRLGRAARGRRPRPRRPAPRAGSRSATTASISRVPMPQRMRQRCSSARVAASASGPAGRSAASKWATAWASCRLPRRLRPARRCSSASSAGGWGRVSAASK